ncbi:fibronectin type III domain-containing protein [Candidatus Saccharibacteria bacterium]|nr:fibronectin type III domain-containing protein [Candidatus Saccharibacteria bacterium]
MMAKKRTKPRRKSSVQRLKYLKQLQRGDRAQCTNLQPSASSVNPGQTFTASYTLTNTGTTTWTVSVSPLTNGYYISDQNHSFTYVYGYKFGKDHPPGAVINVITGLKAPTTPGSYKLAPQVYNGTVPINYACAIKTITVVSPPSPSPGPSPSPQPSPRPSGSGGHPSGGSADTSAPSKPDGFSANYNDTSKSVELSWQAATDNVGVAGYILERSESEQGWTQITDTTDTSYEDSTVSFSASYHYRLKAYDGAKNYSDYATADATTTSFQANVDPSQDSTISSDDKLLSIIIPAGALETQAFCVISTASTQGPTVPNYKVVKGPYELVCRDQAGNVLTTFSSALTLNVQLKQLKARGVSRLDYYGYVDTNWQALSSTTKNHVTQVNLGSAQTFIIMGKKAKTSVWKGIITFILILGALVAIIRYALRFLLLRKYKHQNDDYRNKMLGG